MLNEEMGASRAATQAAQGEVDEPSPLLPKGLVEEPVALAPPANPLN